MLVCGLVLALPILGSQTVEDLGLSLEQLEDKLFFLVNQERSGRGLPELHFDPLLRAMARAHSQKMIQENKLAHDFPNYKTLADRATQTGLYFSDIGENVACSDTFIMRFFHEHLLTSSGHRENILSRRFTHLGIGIGRSGTRHYVTQEFSTLFEPLTKLEMEREMEEKLKILWGRPIELPPASAAEMKEYGRRMSSLFLQDQAPKKIHDSFGVAYLYRLTFTDKETAFDTICAAINADKLLYWSLGVTFDRSAKNIGGTYALSLISFPDLRDPLDAADGLKTVILKSLNKIRKNNDLLSLTMTSNLAKPTMEIAELFYQSPNNQNLIKKKYRYKLILAYKTISLDMIPDDIAQKIVNGTQIHSIGIHVFYPLAQGLPGNYFIVAILGK